MPRQKWAVIEVNFLDDPRIRALTPPQFKVYICLWLMAVECGKETLSKEQSDPNYVAKRANCRRNSVVLLLNFCRNLDEPLVVVDEEGRITVCGASKLHPGMVFANHTIPNHTIPYHTKEVVVSKIFDLWKTVLGRTLRKPEQAQLQALEIKYGSEQVERAILEAQAQGISSMHYVRKVASNGSKQMDPRSLSERAKDFD